MTRAVGARTRPAVRSHEPVCRRTGARARGPVQSRMSVPRPLARTHIGTHTRTSIRTCAREHTHTTAPPGRPAAARC